MRVSRRRPVRGAVGRPRVDRDRHDRASLTEDGIELASGVTLGAELIVTATGLRLAGARWHAAEVDGREVSTSDALVYMGAMLAGVPNFAFVMGYTNASWTLRADLTCRFVTRVLEHMRSHGYRRCAPAELGAGRRAPAAAGSQLRLRAAIARRVPRPGRGAALACTSELHARSAGAAPPPRRRRGAPVRDRQSGRRIRTGQRRAGCRRRRARLVFSHLGTVYTLVMPAAGTSHEQRASQIDEPSVGSVAGDEIATPVLRATGLCHSFGERKVLENLSLTVDGGERVAIVGENGAGKTTLMRICARLLAPQAGTLQIDGRVGYCPQIPGLHELLTPDEHLALFSPAMGLTPQRGDRPRSRAAGRVRVSRQGPRCPDPASVRRLPAEAEPDARAARRRPPAAARRALPGL